MAESASSLLREFEQLRSSYGSEVARCRVDLLRKLEGRSLGRAEEVFRLHELLCFLRAYPDVREVLTRVERMLGTFASRRDLQRHRSRLADTGIAGSDIHYRFYWVTARWLASHWPQCLTVDWSNFDQQEQLLDILDLLVPYCETPALDLVDLSTAEWIDRLKGPKETDATFLIRRFKALKASEEVRERLFERLEIPLKLTPGPGTPSRTLAKLAGGRTVFQIRSLRRERPDLKGVARRRPSAVRELSTRQSQRLISLAREAVVTRQRDLDAFAYADPRDVRMVELGSGLRLACYGLLPERRLLLEASYGFLLLKNGVPIGYSLASSLFRSTEVAYNVFDSFRGGEAAWVFGRLLAAIRYLFGIDVFCIDPYQLGYGNEEGLKSGAWWFYYKLGFRPRDREVRRVLRGELDRLKTNPRHRSSLATLEELAADYLFLYLERQRGDVLGRVSLGEIGLKITEYLAQRFGGDRERGLQVCSEEARSRLGLRSMRGFSAGERLAWKRWSPLLVILPGVEGWSSGEKQALARVVRAKGGRRESDYLRRFHRHGRLTEALLRLAR